MIVLLLGAGLGFSALAWLLLMALGTVVAYVSWIPWVLLVAWLGAVCYYRLHRPTNLSAARK